MATKKTTKPPKVLFGAGKTHTRLQIDLTNEMHGAYRRWCFDNHTAMTKDILAHIAERIAPSDDAKRQASPEVSAGHRAS